MRGGGRFKPLFFTVFTADTVTKELYMNMEIIAAVKKRMKEELLPRQMEKLEIVLHEVFQEQE